MSAPSRVARTAAQRGIRLIAPHPALDPHNVALAARVARESFGYSTSMADDLAAAYAANDRLTRECARLTARLEAIER